MYVYGSTITNASTEHPRVYKNQNTTQQNVLSQGGIDLAKEQQSLITLSQTVVEVCPDGPSLPISVYRTGGYATNPANAAGCSPVLVGTISSVSGSVVVSWVAGSSYSSVETQAVDADGRCVYSGNTKTTGTAASITVSYSNCRIGYPFVNTPPWCNNPMCSS
jgi:hypothetical protein